MGFKARERKRRRKAAVRGKVARTRDQKQARESGSSAGGWWLTPATRKCCCAIPDCRMVLAVGADVVYRHSPREVRCVRCALRSADSRGFRVSVRWDRAQQEKRRRAATKR